MHISRVPGASRRLLWTALPAVLLLSGCNMVVMDPAGDVAMQQRNIVLISTGLMLIIILPVMLCTILFAWRYRETNKTATYDPGFDHSTPLELLIWSAPLLIIIFLGALTWTSTHLLDPFRPLGRSAPGKALAANDRPLDIQVVALDWKWLFIYPEQGVATVNELVLPVNRQVRFSITSSDQMTAFYVPTLAGMIYSMPGMETKLHAVLNKPGTFGGLAAHYNGAGFSDMHFKVYGVDEAGFGRWAAGIHNAGASPINRAVYMRLERPSEKVPVMRFAGVEPGLFGRITNMCIEPGKPCMADVMRHDAGGATGQPVGANDSTAPTHGQHPLGAIQKPASDKGAPPNMTVPRGPGTPGPLAPGSQKNRDLSFNDVPALQSAPAPRA